MIKPNDIIRLKLNDKRKPTLFKEPHYYLCIERDEKSIKCLSFTSNFMKLFMCDGASPSDIHEIMPAAMSVNIFTKRTFIILNEIFVIENVKEPAKMFTKENCFKQDVFNAIIKRISSSAKRYIISKASNVEFI